MLDLPDDSDLPEGVEMPEMPTIPAYCVTDDFKIAYDECMVRAAEMPTPSPEDLFTGLGGGLGGAGAGAGSGLGGLGGGVQNTCEYEQMQVDQCVQLESQMGNMMDQA